VVETVTPLFFECYAKDFLWLNQSSVLHNTALQNLSQFVGLAGRSRVKEARLSVIWFACIWILWKGPNEKIFQQ